MTKHLRRLFWSFLLICVCIVKVSAETKSVVCTLAKDAASSTVRDGDIPVTWTYSAVASQLVNGRGVRFNADKNKSLDLTATFSKEIKITSIVVNAARSGTSGSKSVDVEINGNLLGARTLTNSSTDYTFNVSGVTTKSIVP